MTKPDEFAFPDNFPNGQDFVHHGLTKREWFTGKAMEGILAKNFPQGPSQDTQNSTAHYAVVMADALIAELAKKKP